MKVLRTLGLLGTALVVTSCAPVPPRPPEAQAPPERISQRAYSFVPSSEKGWVVLGRNPDQVALARRGETPDETFAITAILVKLPAFTTSQELMDLVREDEATKHHLPRFRILKHELAPSREKGTDCIKSHLVAEDRAAVKRSARTDDLTLEALSLTCAHPKDRSIGVKLTYSRRYFPDHADPGFSEKTTQVLQSHELWDP